MLASTVLVVGLFAAVTLAQNTVEFFYSPLLDSCEWGPSNTFAASNETANGGLCAYVPQTERLYACPAPDATCWSWLQPCGGGTNTADDGQILCSNNGVEWCCTSDETCTTTPNQINVCISKFASLDKGLSAAQAQSQEYAALPSTAIGTVVSATPSAFATSTLSASTTATSSSSSSSATSSTSSSSTSSASASSTAAAASKSSSLSGGAIAGIVIGVLALLAIVAAIIAFLVLRKRRQARHAPAGNGAYPTYAQEKDAYSPQPPHPTFYSQSQGPSPVSTTHENGMSKYGQGQPQSAVHEAPVPEYASHVPEMVGSDVPRQELP